MNSKHRDSDVRTETDVSNVIFGLWYYLFADKIHERVERSRRDRQRATLQTEPSSRRMLPSRSQTAERMPLRTPSFWSFDSIFGIRSEFPRSRPIVVEPRRFDVTIRTTESRFQRTTAESHESQASSSHVRESCLLLRALYVLARFPKELVLASTSRSRHYVDGTVG